MWCLQDMLDAAVRQTLIRWLIILLIGILIGTLVGCGQDGFRIPPNILQVMDDHYRGPAGEDGRDGKDGKDGKDAISMFRVTFREVVVVIHLHVKPEVAVETEPIPGGVRVYAEGPLTEADLSPEASDGSEVTVTPVSDGAILTVNTPIIVNENPKTIRVEGGSSDVLEGKAKTLTIRTGKHDPFSCVGDHLDVTAYHQGQVRGHQHWDACQVGDDIVVFLKDHPALTCEVGPNTHHLEIEGLAERVIVEEVCQN